MGAKKEKKIRLAELSENAQLGVNGYLLLVIRKGLTHHTVKGWEARRPECWDA
jgi:hypothetical protein